MSIEIQPNPTAGAGTDPAAGNAGQPPAVTPPPGGQPPAARTYTDADMASARRSFEADAKRQRDVALATARAEWERVNAPRSQPDDPWSALDPEAARVLRTILESEFTTRLTPFQQRTMQQTDDLAFAAEEATMREKHKDYKDNRTAILEFAVENGIRNLDMAYRAWKYDELSKIDPAALKKQGEQEYIKKKTQQASTTPAVEARGGGAPSGGKQQLKDYDDMDAAAAEMFRASQES